MAAPTAFAAAGYLIPNLECIRFFAFPRTVGMPVAAAKTPHINGRNHDEGVSSGGHKLGMQAGLP